MHKQKHQQKLKQLKGTTNEHNSNIIHHYAALSSSLRRRKRLAANDILATVAAASTSASLSSPPASSAASLAATATAAVEIEQDVSAVDAPAADSGSNNKRSRKSLTILDKQKQQQEQQQLLPPNAPQISNQPVAAISGNNVKETAATSAHGAVAAGVKDKAPSSKEDSTDNDNDSDGDEDDDDDDDDGAEIDAETETNDEEEDEDEGGEAHDDDADLDEDVAQLATDADYLADGPGDLQEYETVEEVDGQAKHVHMLSLEEQLDLESLEDNVEEEDDGEVDDMYNVSDDDFVASVALSTSDTTAATPLQRTTEGPHIREKATQSQTQTDSATEWQLPHFDYSRMEYSFSNGVVTQSLLGGGAVTGAGHDGFAGGGTINFDNYDNIIYSTMELECMPGYDGGLQQQFFLEAYDSKTKKLRLNMSSTYMDVPVFRIDLSGECVYLINYPPDLFQVLLMMIKDDI